MSGADDAPAPDRPARGGPSLARAANELHAAEGFAAAASRAIALTATLFRGTARLRWDVSSLGPGSVAAVAAEEIGGAGVGAERAGGDPARQGDADGELVLWLEAPLVVRHREVGRLSVLRPSVLRPSVLRGRPPAADAEPVRQARARFADWAEEVARTLDGWSLDEATRRSAQAIDLGLQELVARLGHDLRTPLGAILMWTHVARQSGGSELQAALDAIELGTREQNALIAELVDLTRARAGRLALGRSVIPLVALSEAVVSALADEAQRRGSRVVSRLEGLAADAAVLGDEARLTRALFNLLLHGLRVSDAGTAVHFVVDAADGWARFAVRDAFAGSSRDALERQLARFSLLRFDAQGAGLGVAFSREVIELHGGDLSVHQTSPSSPEIVARLPLHSPAPA